MILRRSGSGKTNVQLSLINNQLFINKIYLDARDLLDSKYQFLIKKRQNVSLKNFKDSSALTNGANDVFEDYNLGTNKNVLIVLDDMISMISDRKCYLLITKIFIRGRKLNIFRCFGANHKVIISCTKRYKTKHRTLLSLEDSKWDNFSKNWH